jgi:hypothetical protein
VQELLEEVERLAVLEDPDRDPLAVGHTVLTEDLLAEALESFSFTSGSVARRWWTISSLETVAAPWRRNDASAVDFPAPIPPVIATAIGRDKR